MKTKRKGNQAERELRKAAKDAGYVVHKSYISRSSADAVLYPPNEDVKRLFLAWSWSAGTWHTRPEWPPSKPLWVQVKHLHPSTFRRDRLVAVRELAKAEDVPLGYVRVAAIRVSGIGRRKPHWHFWVVGDGNG